MRTSADLYSMDANVLIRYFTGDNELLSPKALRIVRAIHNGELAAYCDPVILAEVVWVLRKHYELNPEQVAAALLPFVKSNGVFMSDKRRYIRALELYGNSSAHFGDACACAAALEDCDGRLLSFDRKLSQIEGIERIEEPRPSHSGD